MGDHCPWIVQAGKHAYEWEPIATLGDCIEDGPSPRSKAFRTIQANARLIAAAPDLYEACRLAIPKGVCLTNRNIPDDFTVALDCTMGDLRKIAAALAKASPTPSKEDSPNVE